MQNLYSIKQAADASGVTPRTLRYYEQLGLLKPAKTDKITNYRYYSLQDIVRVVLILSLKDSGMPLEEIAKYLSGSTNMKKTLDILYAQKAAVERSITALKIYSTEADDLEPEVITLPERYCLIKTIIAKDFSDASRAYREFLEESIITGKCVIRESHSFSEFPPEAFNETGLIQNNFPMLVCVPVNPDKPPKGSVLYPATKAAGVNYRGAYENLGKAYEALYTFMQKSGLSQNGNPQEYYIEGEDNIKLPRSRYITRVIIPVK